MTKQRQAILDIIKNSEIHLTAEEIYMEAKKLIPSISLGTVYRNLGVMSDEAEVRKIKAPEGKFIYDKSMKPHGHISCPECGNVIDYNSSDVDEILRRDFGSKLLSYDLIIKCICDECRKKKKEN